MMRAGMLLAIALASLIAAVPASAAPIVECGNHGWIDARGEVGWSMDAAAISGAGTFNVTSRAIGCREARRVSLHSYPGNGYGGWRCRYIDRAHEYADVRCTKAGGRVVRWQTAA